MGTRQWLIDAPELFPQRLSDWLGGQSKLVDYIVAFVQELDLVALGLDKETTVRGAPSYDRRLLLALWLYGLLKGVKTCRKLEEACRLRVDFIYLAGRQLPDHSTLWNFFRDHRSNLKQLLKVVVKTLKSLGLVDGETLLLDGTTIESAGSRRKLLSKTEALKQLARLEAELARRVDQVAEGKDVAEELAPPKQTREHLAEQIRLALQEVENQDEKGAGCVCVTDPESQPMRRKEGGFSPCYNLQVGVDAAEGMIVSVDAVRDKADSHQLSRQVQNAAEVLGAMPKRVVADTGYNTADEFARLEAMAVEAYSPEQINRKNDPVNPFAAANFRYDNERDVMVCPKGNDLNLWRIDRRKVSKTHTTEAKIYRCQDCRKCPAWGTCTSNPNGRTVRRQINEAAKTRVAERVKTETGKKLVSHRKVIEHRFSDIKWRLGVNRVRVWGKEKTNNFMTMVAVALNLERSFRLIAGPPDRAIMRLRIAAGIVMAQMKRPANNAAQETCCPSVRAILASLVAFLASKNGTHGNPHAWLPQAA